MRKRGGGGAASASAPITGIGGMSAPSPSSSSKQRGGAAVSTKDSDKHSHTHRHPVHVDSNAGLFPGFPNLSFNFFSKKSETDLHLEEAEVHDDRHNYALLLALYTLQGIPMGLSASIPFLIQQKVRQVASAAAAAAAASATADTTGAVAAHAAAHHAPSVARMAYNAQAIFALCSWPFSLKLLWAPIVDAVYLRKFGRRKSWLVPVQAAAGIIMVAGSDYVERQLGLANVGVAGGAGGAQDTAAAASFDVKGVTAFFFALYFLMATQDIAVDGWALTMLSKKNRGKGPVCNSIGQNFGYFLSFVGFLALNDADSSENLWRPLLGLKSKPGEGIVSLGGFVRFMGYFMLAVTTFVALFKRELGADPPPGSAAASGLLNITNSNQNPSEHGSTVRMKTDVRKSYLLPEEDEDEELDASKIGLAETYHRLWAVCQLPAVKWLFLILLTYRLPTALSDNVKFLKAVEFGLSKQTTALLSPLIVLPLGIAVPLAASKIWKNHPLRQFTTAYKFRVTLVALLDVLMLLAVRTQRTSGDYSSEIVFWSLILGSTAAQAVAQSLQFNAQMTFFASRVDPAIGGSYMTLLNTAANLGGTWPASAVMYLVGALTVSPECSVDEGGVEVCTGGRDAYFPLQLAFSALGILWLILMGGRVKHVAGLPEEAWRTHLEDEAVEKAVAAAAAGDGSVSSGYGSEMENGQGGGGSNGGGRGLFGRMTRRKKEGDGSKGGGKADKKKSK